MAQLPQNPSSPCLVFVNGEVVPASTSAMQLLQMCSPAARGLPALGEQCERCCAELSRNLVEADIGPFEISASQLMPRET